MTLNVTLTVTEKLPAPQGVEPLPQPYSSVGAVYRPSTVTVTRQGALDPDGGIRWGKANMTIVGQRLKKDGTPGAHEVRDNWSRSMTPPEWLAAMRADFEARTEPLHVAGHDAAPRDEELAGRSSTKGWS